MMKRKIDALYSTYEELEFLHGQNPSLTQELKEYASKSLWAFIDSIENMLQQVKHFHSPLVISREKFQPCQIL